MHRIEPIVEPFRLAPNELCFTREGWVFNQTYKIILQLNPGVSLYQALEVVWEGHRTLLGDGILVFKALELEPRPKGYLVFAEA